MELSPERVYQAIELGAYKAALESTGHWYQSVEFWGPAVAAILAILGVGAQLWWQNRQRVQPYIQHYFNLSIDTGVELVSSATELAALIPKIMKSKNSAPYKEEFEEKFDRFFAGAMKARFYFGERLLVEDMEVYWLEIARLVREDKMQGPDGTEMVLKTRSVLRNLRQEIWVELVRNLPPGSFKKPYDVFEESEQ